MLELATKTINLIREQLIKAITDLILPLDCGVSIPWRNWPTVCYTQGDGEPTIMKAEHVTTFDGNKVSVCGVCHGADGRPFQDTPDLSLIDTDGLVNLFSVLTECLQR